MSRRSSLHLVVLVAGLLALAGCGGDSEPTTTDSAATTSALDTSTKPEVTVPDEPPPSDLAIEDLVEGTGATAQPGSNLTVQYVGVDYETGKEFDASWDRGQPFPFQLAPGMVIAGWVQGLVGMKVGGRRELIIPPDLAYGKQGSPPAIGRDATLVFVIDLLDVQ